ncbi:MULTISPECIES: agmatinase [unclassified Coleofasciculus]|uniref:agmatinase n=1 Tax=unclassified Coleofasciculus TaxID=2692782 RepID=UPI00187F2550|nr:MULTISPECIES: agmatinase [unclassified Coleofasciculus]MBE9126428.1 agmatinase [Coleofasciculus sp. LEGE 07081]MBE9148030.1 agmatinase [Coleofasciculus sp. LEGE 07092]
MLVQTPTAVVPFLGSEIKASYETSRVVVLPIPYEATTTYRKGCENGPDALLDASPQLEYYDDELERESCWDAQIYTHSPIADTRGGQSVSSETMLRLTRETVSRLIEDDKFVIALGGEHSITTGIVDAYRLASSEPFTVVQIDAHGDLRHEYEGSIYNHACVMRRIVEMGLPTLPVAIRSLCQEEANLIKEKSIPVMWARDIAQDSNWIDRAIANISTQCIFITIDLDGIDPAMMPGVGTPEPGGLNWYALTAFLRRLFETYEVIGCDVMELAPVVDSVVSQFTAAKLVYKLMGYQVLAKGW